jgi:putative membrane protein
MWGRHAAARVPRQHALTLPPLPDDLAVRLCVLVAVVGLAIVYSLGWRTLRRRGRGNLPPRWHLWSYLAGLGTIAIALTSPLDDLADTWFSAHMIQHLLLTMMAAPLLLLGNPLPVCLWGLPRRARHALAQPLTRQAAVRRLLEVLTRLPVAWATYVAILWLWHVPVMYEAALESQGLHVLEHGMFFGSALIFWWPIIRPAPRLHPQVHPGFEIFYLVAATAQNTALGAFLSLQEHAIYPHYARVSRASGLTVDDQVTAGGLMWINGHMYLLPILVLLWRFSQQADEPGPGATLPAEETR